MRAVSRLFATALPNFFLIFLLTFIFLPSHSSAQVIPNDSLTTDSIVTAVDTPSLDTPVVKSKKGDLKGNKDGKKDKKDRSVVELPEDQRKDKKKNKVPKENMGVADGDEKHDPNKAARRSLVLPGWGQVYNRSWWKVPIIYGGFGAFAYFAVDNHRRYITHRDIAICKLRDACNDTTAYPDFVLYDVNSVITIRDFHRRYRDFNIILGGLWYAIQVIDALVEAHLKDFNVTPDLSMRLKPDVIFNPRNRSNVMMGATLSIRLRR
ncbi:MAG: DUF5683 domain-containing protein [Bacteroidota bacterium]